MISHTKKFIFIHIPKTGGTSLEYVLGKYGTMLQGKRNFDSIYYKHAVAETIKRALGDEYDKYFKFTFIRNPWDWVVSNYAFNRGLSRPFVTNTAYSISGKVPEWSKNTPFPEWLAWWIETCNPTQAGMFTDASGNLLVDAVFRFESLGSDFKKLKSRAGLRCWKLSLPHLKASSRERDYMSYYTDDCRTLMERHFKADFNCWESDKS